MSSYLSLFRARCRSKNLRRALPSQPKRRLFLESLEGRRVLATLYVDNAADYTITSDQGVIGTVDAGDTVTFNAGAASQHGGPVAGLKVGLNAFTSIQAAVDAAAAGSTIRVGPGTFAERVVVDTQVQLLGNQVDLDAQSALRTGLPVTETVVTGVGNNGETPFYVTASGVEINGFTIEGATNSANLGYGIVLGAGTSGSEVRNNIVQENIIGLALANNSASSQTVIENNLFINNNQPGAAGGTAIYSDQYVAGGALTNVLISENTFVANSNAAINIATNDPSKPASDITISENFIAFNGTAVRLQNTLDSSIENNEIVGSTNTQIDLRGGVEDLSIVGNFIINGGADGIVVQALGGASANENITILGNSIANNAGAGLRLEVGAYNGSLNAQYNWWGASSGPLHALNAGGTGEAIIDPGLQVDALPFLTALLDSLPGVPGLQVVTADLSIEKSASASTAIPGGTVTYTIVVSNDGPDDLTGVTVADTVSAQLTNVTYTSVASAGVSGNTSGTGNIDDTVSLEAGSSITYTVTGTVLPSATGTLSNTASVTAAENTVELDSDNNSATVDVALTPQADLSITKTASAATVKAGEFITYTIVVTNAGLSDAQDVSLDDLVPTGTTFVSLSTVAGWTNTTPAVGATGEVSSDIDTLPAGSSATFTLVVRADPTLTTGASVSNTAEISAATTDISTGNNEATATVTVRPPGLIDCEVVTLNVADSSNTAVVVDDADNPGEEVLIVTGTSGNDSITIDPIRGTTRFQVKRSSQVLGTFEIADVPRIVVFGLSGNDTVRVNAALTQDVILFGDAGNDKLYGGAGDDGIDGGSGNDLLYAGAGNDIVCGGDGNDTLFGQAGNDLLGGADGNDRLYGDAGDDQLLGGEGNDTLSGGVGNDRLYGEEGNDSLSADTGNDVVVGGIGNDRINGGAGLDLLIGSDGSDTISGSTEADIAIGGSTDHDEDDEALLALLAEWTSSAAYNLRLNNLQLGGGLNGTATLSSSTVDDDGDSDTIFGQSGQDWFFFGSGDRIRDRVTGENVS